MFVKSRFRCSLLRVSALCLLSLAGSGCDQEVEVPLLDEEARAATGPVYVMESRPWKDPVTGEDNNWNLCAEQTQWSALKVEVIRADILNGDVCKRVEGSLGKDSLDVQLTLELYSLAGDLYDVGFSFHERDADAPGSILGRVENAAQPTTGMGMFNGDAYDKDTDLFLGLENSPKNTCGDLSASQGKVVWTVQTKLNCKKPIPYFGGTHTMVYPTWRTEPQEVCTPSFRSTFEGAKCNNGQFLNLSPFLELCHFLPCDDPSACNPGCQAPVCGNGVVEGPNEACDDGNRDDTDACSNACKKTAVCGNGVKEGGELCDDGNSDEQDGCTSDCKPGPICGNGIKEGSEACDDGNDQEDDGCSNTCKRLAVCGDGVVEGQEECDDGNVVETDACSNACKKLAVCGNGVVEAGEQCDDGNRIDTDACNNSCVPAPVCGNGVREGLEECDDGNSNDLDACSNACNKRAVCGNGVVEAGEQCDDGNRTDNDACTNACTPAPVCGNGVVEAGEQCDDGNDVDTDTCNKLCQVVNGSCGGATTPPASE